MSLKNLDLFVKGLSIVFNHDQMQKFKVWLCVKRVLGVVDPRKYRSANPDRLKSRYTTTLSMDQFGEVKKGSVFLRIRKDKDSQYLDSLLHTDFISLLYHYLAVLNPVDEITKFKDEVYIK